MKTTIKSNFVAILPACLLACLNPAHAGDFQTYACGTSISKTGLASTSNDASIGYDNISASSTCAFIYGGTNAIRNFVNAAILGSNNTIAADGEYCTGADAGIFGSNNDTIIDGGPNSSLSGAYILGNNNKISSTGAYGSLSNAFAIGNNNSITNAADYHDMANAYAIGSGNSIAEASRVVVIGMDNTVSASASDTYILGSNINATNPNNVILGSDSADGCANPVFSMDIGKIVFIPAAGSAPVGIVSVGAAGRERQIVHVAAGRVEADSTDAINGSQLFATNKVLADMGASLDALAGTSLGDALLWNASLNAYDASRDMGWGGGAGTAQRIANVANGFVAAGSLDAINGSQLHAAATGILDLIGTGSVNPDGTITGGTPVNQSITNLNQTINNIISGSAGLVRRDDATGNITIGAQAGGSVVDISGANGDRQIAGVAAGTADNDAVNVGQLRAAGIISGTGSTTFTANVVAYDSAAKTSVMLEGSGGTRITNLALAAINAASTDAVTGSQLFDTNQRVTTLETIVATITSATTPPTPPSPSAGNPHFSTGTDDPGIPATANGGNAVAAGMGATASGASSSALGMNAKATASQSVAIGAHSEARAQSGVALGNNALVAATAANSVAIGANSIATDPNTVSFGSVTLQRRLVNIADGINPTDAVNMRQLAAFENATRNIFANLQDRVNALDDRMDSVGALSAAMNQVHPRLSVSNRNRNQIALGIGAYRSRGAFALGYGYTCPLGDRGVQASFALSDTGEIMAGAGAVLGW